MGFCWENNDPMKRHIESKHTYPVGIKHPLRLIVLILTVAIAAARSPSLHAFSDDRDQYRRSSLCLVLLAHSEKDYVDAMINVFNNFPLPQRYNEHNISDLRVIRVTGKQNQKDIERLIEQNCIPRKVIGRWFNHNPATGFMDMSLVHSRGGYGASKESYDMVKDNVRGTAMLRDEGLELLQNTFVLVCDMDYIDQKNRAKWGELALGLVSAGLQATAAVQQEKANADYARGNYAKAQKRQSQAQTWSSGADLSLAASAVVGDIGGFRVKMTSYLYQIDWDNKMTDAFFRDYWCDPSMSSDEIAARNVKFKDEKKMFRLKFVGKYQAKSSKTILRSWSNEGEVILDVCQRCVDKGINELARKYVVFRPRAPFYFEGMDMYSHIGRKEGVAYGRDYEILQPYKDKHGRIQYKKIAKAKAAKPWDNLAIHFDEYFDETEKGTRFHYNGKKEKLEKPGLQLREL